MGARVLAAVAGELQYQWRREQLLRELRSDGPEDLGIPPSTVPPAGASSRSERRYLKRRPQANERSMTPFGLQGIGPRWYVVCLSPSVLAKRRSCQVSPS